MYRNNHECYTPLFHSSGFFCCTALSQRCVYSWIGCSGHSLIRKLTKGKDVRGVCETVIAMLPYKKHVLTITTDNGPEFAEHKLLAKVLDTKVYFAHPYCTWEKGLIEYTNKLYRQFIPKGANFEDFRDDDVFTNSIQNK